MGGVAGAIIGANQAQVAQDNANAARQSALQQYTGISAPDVAEQQLAFQQYQNAGNLGIQNEQALQQGPNAMAGISTDPRLQQAQMAALNQLSTTGQMGMTPGEQAALTQAQQGAAAQAQAKSKAILEDFARRGMGGSGNELASQLQNAQSSSQQLANNSNQIAQNAQQNAMQAMAQSGQLGGQMQAAQFGQQADVAKAQNYINQFNTQNSQQVQNQNTQAANAAALRNLTNQQNLMQQNTQLSNQQQQYNKQLLQQQFNNQVGLAAGRAGQYNGIAQAQQQNAANTANQWAGIGQGVDTGVGALYNSSKGSSGGDGSNFEDYGSAGQSGGGYGQGLSESEMNGGPSMQSGMDADIGDVEEIYGGGGF